MDVYLTHNLEDELAVLQHPLRPPWRSEDPGLLQAIRYKPNAEVRPCIGESKSTDTGDGLQFAY